MKTIILATATFLLLIACNDDNKNLSTETTVSAGDSTEREHDTATKSILNGTVSTHEVLASYLQIKNGLATDDGAAAAAGGDGFVRALSKIDTSSMSASQKTTFEDVADDAKEMAEHIGKSASKLEHQREHFDMLSKDMYDMVKSLGTDQPLYQDYCPMYNNKKGATWLSETKEIKNPYMGKKQPDCGTLKEEIK